MLPCCALPRRRGRGSSCVDPAAPDVEVDRGGECAAACSAVKATRFAGAANKFAATLTASARCRNSSPVIDGPLRRSKLPRRPTPPPDPVRLWASLEAIPSEPPSLACQKLARDGGGEGMAAHPLGEPEHPPAATKSRRN